MRWILHGGRATGKTYRLIQYSAWTRVPILVTTMTRSAWLKDTAKSMGVEIPDPVIWGSGKRLRTREVIIDNAEEVLDRILGVTMGVSCEGIAVSAPIERLERPFIKIDEEQINPFISCERGGPRFVHCVNGLWGEGGE